MGFTSLCMSSFMLIASGPVDVPSRPATTRPARSIAELASCSSLCQMRQPLDTALKTIAEIGFRWVDLSAFPWAPHVNIAELVEDFDREARRVESALAEHGLGVSNFTFESVDVRPFEQYEPQFRALVRLAGKLDVRLINLMAPSPKSDRDEMVDKLRKVQAIAEEGGVLLSVETHVNQITERPEDALWLCRQVPGLGLTLDPSHYYAGPHQGASFDELYPLVYGTGFRAGGMSWDTIQLPWGEGPIDFVEIVRKLEAAGYKGFYVAEYLERFQDTDAVAESRRFFQWTQELTLDP
jgi:sugar phosphate isomerase/epimerase